MRRQNRSLQIGAAILAFFIAISLLTYQSVKDAPRSTVTPTRITGPCRSQIAYVSTFSLDNPEIYIMDADSTDVKRLTNNSADDNQPAWSGDGTRIAFASNRNGTSKADYDIYVMNADGSDQHRLTDNPTVDTNPAWSPDNTKIAFDSMRNSQWNIFVMNADGTGTQQLTNQSDNLSPSWSPDGSRIVFSSRRDNPKSYLAHIYVMNADGSHQQDLTPATGGNLSPKWSPDGSRIAFISTRDGVDSQNLETHHLYVMNADGTNQHRVSDNLSEYAGVSWSPDSVEIVFSTVRDQNRDIYTLNLLTGSYKRLTSNSVTDYEPAWGPCLN